MREEEGKALPSIEVALSWVGSSKKTLGEESVMLNLALAFYATRLKCQSKAVTNPTFRYFTPFLHLFQPHPSPAVDMEELLRVDIFDLFFLILQLFKAGDFKTLNKIILDMKLLKPERTYE